MIRFVISFKCCLSGIRAARATRVPGDGSRELLRNPRGFARASPDVVRFFLGDLGASCGFSIGFRDNTDGRASRRGFEWCSALCLVACAALACPRGKEYLRDPPVSRL